MEQIYVLGTGNASAIRAFNTCFVLKDGEEMLLTDSGGGNGLLSRMEKETHTQPLYIYGHQEVLDMLDSMCRMMLRPQFYRMIGKHIFFVPVQDGETRRIAGWEVTFFDIGSEKTRQYGYRLTLHNGRTIVFAGDEPLKEPAKTAAYGADWLLREVLCCYADRERFQAYEKKHDTVREACEQAVELQVRHLMLWHVEDRTGRQERKAKYLAEGEAWLAGCTHPPELHVPVDGEIITL